MDAGMGMDVISVPCRPPVEFLMCPVSNASAEDGPVGILPTFLLREK